MDYQKIVQEHVQYRGLLGKQPSFPVSLFRVGSTRDCGRLFDAAYDLAEKVTSSRPVHCFVEQDRLTFYTL